MPTLLSLPTELLHAIISQVLLFPETWHIGSSSLLRPSFDTLLSLSVVSKYLRALSTPYIFKSLILSPDAYGLRRNHCTYLEPLQETYNVAMDLVQQLKVDIVVDRFVANKKKWAATTMERKMASIAKEGHGRRMPMPIPMQEVHSFGRHASVLEAPDREEMEYLTRCLDDLASSSGRKLKDLKISVKNYRCRLHPSFPQYFGLAVRRLERFRFIESLELNLPAVLREEAGGILLALKGNLKELKLAIGSEATLPVLSKMDKLRKLDLLLASDVQPSSSSTFQHLEETMQDFKALEDLHIHSEDAPMPYSGARTSSSSDDEGLPFLLDFEILRIFLEKSRTTLRVLTIEECVLVFPLSADPDVDNSSTSIDPIRFTKLQVLELHLGANIVFSPPPPPSFSPSIYHHLLCAFAIAPLQTLKICSNTTESDMAIWEPLRMDAEGGGNGRWKALREIRARKGVVEELEEGGGREGRRGREWRAACGVELGVGKFTVW